MVTDLAKMAFNRASCLETSFDTKLARVAGPNLASVKRFQQARADGLDACKACSWQGWYDHTAICTLAQSLLALARVTTGDHVNRDDPRFAICHNWPIIICSRRLLLTMCLSFNRIHSSLEATNRGFVQQ